MYRILGCLLALVALWSTSAAAQTEGGPSTLRVLAASGQGEVPVRALITRHLPGSEAADAFCLESVTGLRTPIEFAMTPEVARIRLISLQGHLRLEVLRAGGGVERPDWRGAELVVSRMDAIPEHLDRCTPPVVSRAGRAPHGAEDGARARGADPGRFSR